MKIILTGALGRMGKMITECAPQHGIEIVCGVDVSSAPAPYPIYNAFAEVTQAADGVIDFSSPKCLKSELEFCKRHGLPLLLAATGYTDDDVRLIESYSEEIAVFKTGNLSLGINLLQLLVKKAAAILGDGFDAEIIERHHGMKKDAPSGTALMLGQSVRDGFNEDKTFIFGRQGMVGERKKAEIGIHAVRGGTIVGEHEVMFAGEDEIITLSHSARSRKVFALGALRAIIWLKDKSAGLYDMDDMLSEII